MSNNLQAAWQQDIKGLHLLVSTYKRGPLIWIKQAVFQDKHLTFTVTCNTWTLILHTDKCYFRGISLLTPPER